MTVAEAGALHGPASGLHPAPFLRAPPAQRPAPWPDLTLGLSRKAARVSAVRVARSMPGREILEVGLGTGRHLRLYAGRLVTGVDPAAAAVLAAQSSHAAATGLAGSRPVRVDLFCRDPAATGFLPASFDVVVLMMMDLSDADPAAIVAEARRVLRPDGALVAAGRFPAAAAQGASLVRRVLGGRYSVLLFSPGW